MVMWSDGIERPVEADLDLNRSLLHQSIERFGRELVALRIENEKLKMMMIPIGGYQLDLSYDGVIKPTKHSLFIRQQVREKSKAAGR